MYGFDVGQGRFIQCYGGIELDVSLLLLLIYGFFFVDDECICGIVCVIEIYLDEDGLFKCYCNEFFYDGLEVGEGSFIVCGFWLVYVKLFQGECDEVEWCVCWLLFVVNDLGLFLEEYDVLVQCQCGNFLQVLLYVVLINIVMVMGV